MIRPYGVKSDPFPTRLHARCKYATTGSLSTNATATQLGSDITFRLNSIWDPYYPTGGSTVVGHSNFTALYNRYIVNGAKVEIVFTDPTSDGMTCFASLNQTNTLSGLYEKGALEQALVYSNQINNTGSQKNRMVFYIRPWSLVGLTKLEWLSNKTIHSSAMTTNPSQDLLLRINCACTTGGVQNIQYKIRILYYTEFFERRQLYSSTS